MKTGRDLAAERVRAGLRMQEIAEHMGISRSRVAAIEYSVRHRPSTVQRYLAAIALAKRATREPSVAP